MKLTPGMYRFFSRIMLPVAKLYLKKRAKKQPAYLEHWDERFGTIASYPVTSRPRLWVHAVSVGETAAARPLIDAFLTEFPESEILLTCMTPTGRDTGDRIAKAWPGRIAQCYLPYDNTKLMRKFLTETAPKAGVVMETEVWPNMMVEANALGIPMILANARESEKSMNKASSVMEVMRPAFAAFDDVLAQSEEDAERLTFMGAKNVTVCGSVKFDCHPDPVQVKAAKENRAALGRPVILLASTRQGEEKMFIDEIASLKTNAVVLLVPRHPQRFDEIAQMLESEGIRFMRRSTLHDFSSVLSDVRVILGDSMGEMSLYCAMADVCVMGGSFGNFGCQNLIEPAAAGVPVIVGPSDFNFAKIVADAVEQKAAVRASDAAEALKTAEDWLTDGALAERSEYAGAFARTYTGATERQMCFVRKVWNR